MKMKIAQCVLSMICTAGMLMSVTQPIVAATESSTAQLETVQETESIEQNIETPSDPESTPESNLLNHTQQKDEQPTTPSGDDVVTSEQTPEVELDNTVQQTEQAQEQEQSEDTTVQANEPIADETGLITYSPSFETMSSWKLAHGKMNYQASNGKLVFETADGNETVSNPPYALVADENSPVLADGELKAHLNCNAAGRFALVFRYQDKDNYAAVGYDISGRWMVKKVIQGKETEQTIENLTLDPQKGVDVAVMFSGNDLQINLNGESVYNSADFLQGVPAQGKMGLRTWGYAGNYAKVTFDSLSYNQIPKKETDDQGNYKVTFTDNLTRGGWKQDGQTDAVWEGKGIQFTDGNDGAGYMTISAGPEGTNNGESYFTDMRAPYIDNGFIEMDLTNQSDGRIAILMRYNGTNDYVALQYDVGGNWNLAYNGKYTQLAGIPALEKGVKHHIRLEYVGESIRMEMDNQEVLNQKFDGISTKAGRIGIRAWGYGNGGNLGKADVDNVVNGVFNAVLLDPSQSTILESELGSYDISVQLSQTANALTAIKNGEKTLVAQQDYVQQGQTVILKADYLKTLKGSNKIELSFLFADGYIVPFTISVSQLEENKSYQRDFSKGIDGFALVQGNANLSANAEKKSAEVSNAQNAILIDQNSPELHNAEAKFTFDPKNDNGNLAVVLRYQDNNNWVAVGIDAVGGNHTQWYVYTPSGKFPLFANDDDQKTQGDGDGQRLLSKRDAPYTVQVRLVEDTVTVWVDGSEIAQSTITGLPGGSGKVGVRYTGNAGADIYNLSYLTSNPLEQYTGQVTQQTIASEQMKVTLDKDFPRVIQYELDGKTMQGQQKAYRAIELNNTLTKVNVTSEFSGNKAVYHLDGQIDDKPAKLDIVFVVSGNVLDMKLENISENIRTVNFPNQSLVSVTGSDKGASLRQNNYSRETSYDLNTRRAAANHQYTSLAVVNNDQLAGVVNCGSFKSRSELVFYTMQNGSDTVTALWPNEFIIRGLDNDRIQGGDWAQVAIAADRNGDKKVDYQDGAIALRDDIPTKRVNNPEIINGFTSIAVNEASGVQYPFLNTLDQVKK